MKTVFEMNAWGPVCALGASLTWAIGSSTYAKLSRTYSAFAINFTRALVAFPLFLVTVFIMAGGWDGGLSALQEVRTSHWGWFTLSMTASYGLGDVVFLWSTRHLGVPSSLAIASCYPIWTTALGYFYEHEKLSFSKGVGLLIALTGIVLVILNGPEKIRESKEASNESRGEKTIWKGVLLAILTSIAWATNSFSTGQGGADLPAPVGNTVRMGVALILTAVFARIFESRTTSLLLPWKTFKESLLVLVFEAFGGSFFYIYGLSHSNLALGSTLASLAPVISVPIALILRTERFSIVRTLGVLVVVFGVWLLVGGGDSFAFG